MVNIKSQTRKMSDNPDELFGKLYKACVADGLGGEMKFVNQFFTFLRTKTPLLKTPASVKKVQELVRNHCVSPD